MEVNRPYPKPTSERPHPFIEGHPTMRHVCILCASRESHPIHDPVLLTNYKARWFE